MFVMNNVLQVRNLVYKYINIDENTKHVIYAEKYLRIKQWLSDPPYIFFSRHPKVKIKKYSKV